eukprot:COSAG02_NODE_2853_length_7891_cov_7.789913_7_plen_105_part_00
MEARTEVRPPLAHTAPVPAIWNPPAHSAATQPLTIGRSAEAQGPSPPGTLPTTAPPPIVATICDADELSCARRAAVRMPPRMMNPVSRLKLVMILMQKLQSELF